MPFVMRKKYPFPKPAARSRRAKIAVAALCVFSGVPALFAERTQFTPYSSDDGRYGEITENPWYGDKELSGGMTSAGGTFLVRFGEYIVYDGEATTAMKIPAPSCSSTRRRTARFSKNSPTA